MITETKYKDYLPLYLKRGVKVNEWLGFLTDLIINYESSLEGIFEILTFQTNVVFDTKGQIIGPKADGYRAGLLKIAAWFGITRTFTCNIKATGEPVILKLSDREIFRLLRTQLWKIGFDGTTESLENNIKRAFDISDGIKDLEILIFNEEEPASARIVCIYAPGRFSTNDTLLWNNGYYNNPVLGINYIYQAVSNDRLIYDFNIDYDGGWYDYPVPLVTEAPSTPNTGDMWVTVSDNVYTLHTYIESGSVYEVLFTAAPSGSEAGIIVGTKYYVVASETLRVWGLKYIYDSEESINGGGE